MDKLRSGKYSREASLNLLRQPAERCRQMVRMSILFAPFSMNDNQIA